MVILVFFGGILVEREKILSIPPPPSKPKKYAEGGGGLSALSTDLHFKLEISSVVSFAGRVHGSPMVVGDRGEP